MFEIRLQKDVKGKGIGWDWDMLPFTIKEGCTTYIGSAPASATWMMRCELPAIDMTRQGLGSVRACHHYCAGSQT